MENKFPYCVHCGKKKSLTANLYCSKKDCRNQDPVVIEQRRKRCQKFRKTDAYKKALEKYRASEKWRRAYSEQKARLALGIKKPRTRATETLKTYLAYRLMGDLWQWGQEIQKVNNFISKENKIIERLVRGYEQLDKLWEGQNG